MSKSVSEILGSRVPIGPKTWGNSHMLGSACKHFLLSPSYKIICSNALFDIHVTLVIMLNYAVWFTFVNIIILSIKTDTIGVCVGGGQNDCWAAYQVNLSQHIVQQLDKYYGCRCPGFFPCKIIRRHGIDYWSKSLPFCPIPVLAATKQL